MSSAVSDLIEKQNFESETVNLLTEGSVPEDCDLLIIDGPTSDLADDEKDMLTEYMAQGGHMIDSFDGFGYANAKLEEFMGNYGYFRFRWLYCGYAEFLSEQSIYNISDSVRRQ